MYETGIHCCWNTNSYEVKTKISDYTTVYSNLGWSFEVTTTTQLNHVLYWISTIPSDMKHVNYPTTMDWISKMWSMIKILLSVWPLTCIYIHIELCMMLFYFICHRKYCFILYSFTYMYTYLLNQVPGWHPRARLCAHLKLLLQYKTLSLWVLGGWTSHLGLFNIC